ncbi:MAG TPA: NAD(P)/FAD-dependent oxidoreductase [Gemmatimonadales bacterium]|nr:NAD(P)/FAD-dependent oxidoreductase [Gemmatimonadales bacterium]
MTAGYDAIVIGAGVNGLTAATILARAGRRTLLLERREGIGGLARGAEFAPGFRSSPLGLEAGWLPPPVARALGLPALELALPEATVAVPAGEQEWLVLSRDIGRSSEAIRRYSAADAGKWRAFSEQLAKHAGVLAALYTRPPPEIDARGLGELLPLLGVARRLRGLGRRDMLALLRSMPMAVQELLDDWFESVPLKAALAAGAVRDLRQGPRSGGTAFGLLHRQVGRAPGAIGGQGFWKAGPEALSEAIGGVARTAGVELRAAADVMRILAQDDRVTGVELADGEEITARAVLSSADPARTLLDLVDPVWFDPEFLLAIRQLKLRGSATFISYALDGLPEFAGLPDAARALLGSLSLSSSLEALERAADAAKYGRISERPHVELQIPSLRWPELAPVGKHVLVARAQWAPYALRDGEWNADRRARLGDRVTAAIAERAPGFGARILHREVLAPPDVERRYGCTEGAPTQGEMTLDQILFMRPVPGASRYATPLAGLYLCGAGCHPGYGIAGAPGWLAAKQLLADQSRV